MLKKSLLIATVCIFYSCITSTDNPQDGKEYIHVGAAVPTFSVNGKGDETFSSPKDFEGKLTLLMFFTTWCPSCQKQIPYVEEAWNSFKDDEAIQFICIARGGEGSYAQTPEIVEEFWRKNDLHMQWFTDPDREVFNMFADNNVPRFYLIDESSTVVWKQTTDSYTAEQFIEVINQFAS